jgi:hypothetical protein
MPTFSFLLHQLDNVCLNVIGMCILHLIVFIVYGTLVEYYIFCCIFLNLLLWVVAMRMFKNTILVSSIFKVEPSLLRIL